MSKTKKAVHSKFYCSEKDQMQISLYTYDYPVSMIIFCIFKVDNFEAPKYSKNKSPFCSYTLLTSNLFTMFHQHILIISE